MIAMKREVAAGQAGFSVERMSKSRTLPGLRKLTTSHCTNKEVCKSCRNNRCEKVRSGYDEPASRVKNEDTHGRVYSHRLSYLERKVRKGGDFFYGKSGNENYIESL